MVHYHLTQASNGWRLRQEGSGAALAVFETKEEALFLSARHLEEHSGCLKIHGPDGRVEEERIYPQKASVIDLEE